MPLAKLASNTFQHMDLDCTVLGCDAFQNLQWAQRIVLALNNQRWTPDRFKCGFIVGPRPPTRRNGVPEHHQRRRRLDSRKPRAYPPAE